MATSSFTLNGTAIKRPSTFKIERYLITNLQRLANGDMAGDYITKKRKFFFTYEAITSTQLNIILNALWETTTLFHTLAYTESNVAKTATVYVGSIPTDLYRTGDVWTWKNVTFDLIEK